MAAVHGMSLNLPTECLLQMLPQMLMPCVGSPETRSVEGQGRVLSLVQFRRLQASSAEVEAQHTGVWVPGVRQEAGARDGAGGGGGGGGASLPFFCAGPFRAVATGIRYCPSDDGPASETMSAGGQGGRRRVLDTTTEVRAHDGFEVRRRTVGEKTIFWLSF